ncbi:hypothetical protein ANANG_G00277170 [Anguilla anguilla]|uniref:Uncharacterized protein n=1 Tax=Anguilla anguilla TaxID=7936 RepID=A0A9D3LQ34_ANGAN|nr:hypothetical protein ANANG_G00277170 [Anguilla anguilla]
MECGSDRVHAGGRGVSFRWRGQAGDLPQRVPGQRGLLQGGLLPGVRAGRRLHPQAARQIARGPAQRGGLHDPPLAVAAGPGKRPPRPGPPGTGARASGPSSRRTSRTRRTSWNPRTGRGCVWRRLRRGGRHVSTPPCPSPPSDCKIKCCKGCWEKKSCASFVCLSVCLSTPLPVPVADSGSTCDVWQHFYSRVSLKALSAKPKIDSVVTGTSLLFICISKESFSARNLKLAFLRVYKLCLAST